MLHCYMVEDLFGDEVFGFSRRCLSVIFVNVWIRFASKIWEMDHFGGEGQLSLLVTKVLTLRRIGLVVPAMPVKNSLSAVVANWLLVEVVPEYKVAIVIEHTRGPA